MDYTTFLLFILGLALLSFGADWLVCASLSLAQKLKIPAIIVGMTIIAWGTSLPEIFVSIEASLRGLPGISVGNVVGSNIANFLLIAGLTALILPLKLTKESFRRDGVFLIIFTLSFFFFFYQGIAQLWHGFILLGLVVLHALWMSFDSYKNKNRNSDEDDSKSMPLFKALLFVFIGILMLTFGGEILITSAVSLARTFNISEATIGVTLVALGTSLPELAASLAAARRKESQLIIGNLIGSNIYNIGAVMGLVALLAPGNIPLNITSPNLWFMLCSSLGLIAWLGTGRAVNRKLGFTLLLLYLVFTALLLGKWE